MSVVWAPYSQLRPLYPRQGGPPTIAAAQARRAQQNPSMNIAIDLRTFTRSPVGQVKPVRRYRAAEIALVS